VAYASVGLKTHIWNNNLKSMLLLAGFPLLIFAMMWAFFTIVDVQQFAGPWQDAPINTGSALEETLIYSPYIFGGVAIWFLIAWFFHQGMINRATGAKPVSRTEQLELYNMLENMCISRGITMPHLCVIENDALNAYASGLKESNYTITLTTGIIQKLNAEELEAVIGHELTHIMNRDVRLLVISIIFVGILSFLAEMAFRAVLRGSGRSRKGGGPAIIIGLVILLIGYLFAILIRFALSRKREYLADAGAVELTKNPAAMISALEKISGKAEMKGAPEEVKQMFIEHEPKHGFMNVGLFSIFATHPPIEKRIDVLKGML